MSAFEVTENLEEAIVSKKYNAIICNYANGDMVGHTGILPAAIKAVEVVDICVGKLTDKVLSLGGRALITADHGNAEVMVDETGGPHTAHTCDVVPFLLVDDARKNVKLRSGGILADLAPTMLSILGIPQPKEMTGKSLIV